MQLKWSEPALEDLGTLRDLIAKDSSLYARQFIEKIFDAAKNLKAFPELGRTLPEAERSDVREILFRNYRIIYLIQPDHISVLAVLHGSRNLAGIEKKPWEMS